MNDEDLRDQLAKAIDDEWDRRDENGDTPEPLYESDVNLILDGLVPAVREMCAQAWDDCAEAAYEWQIGVTGKPDNPWRKDQP